MNEERKIVAQVMVTTWVDIPTNLSVVEANRLLAAAPDGWGLVTEGDCILAVIHADDAAAWRPTERVADHRDELAPLLSVEASLPLDQATGRLARFLRLSVYRPTRGVLVEANGEAAGILPKSVLMAEAGRPLPEAVERRRVRPLPGTPLTPPSYWVCRPNEQHDKPIYTLMPGHYTAAPICKSCGQRMQREE